MSQKTSLTSQPSAPDSVIQAYGALMPVRVGLRPEVRYKSIAVLNRMLAHTLALRDLYKKSHWQTSGATFYQLHLLFDKHHGEQVELADALAERVQTLGGVSLALPRDAAQESRLSHAPRGRESVRAELTRLADAHELVLMEARVMAREVAERGDDGTNDLLVSQLVRTNELQSWFIAEHLVTAEAGRSAS